jgi:hypothetical protein
MKTCSRIVKDADAGEDNNGIETMMVLTTVHREPDLVVNYRTLGCIFFFKTMKIRLGKRKTVYESELALPSERSAPIA